MQLFRSCRLVLAQLQSVNVVVGGQMRFHRTPVKLRRPLRPGANCASADPAVVTDTIEEIVRIVNKESDHNGFSDVIEMMTTSISGNTLLDWLHMAWFNF